jgi:hypothetical protein
MMIILREFDVKSPHRLPQLAVWYRDFADRAGNPAIWEARLRTAKALEEEADRLDARSADRNKWAAPAVDRFEPKRSAEQDKVR